MNTTDTQPKAERASGSKSRALTAKHYTAHTPETISERIIQCWFAGIPCPDLRALADTAPALLAACKQALPHLGHTTATFGQVEAAIRSAEGSAQIQLNTNTLQSDLLHLIDRLYSACNSAYPWLCKAKASQVEKNTVLPRALDIAISNVQDAARQAQETLKKHGRI